MAAKKPAPKKPMKPAKPGKFPFPPPKKGGY